MRVAEVGKSILLVSGSCPGEPGVRCVVLEQSAGLVWFGANRNPYGHACC